ncbi:MAG TPA: HAMP domain-containing sensor histidine kinase [Prolixibacteraceae bacterium]|nr:HAMP domain-containing sensor histidine kinase [Prolixibacteraceae bacterium]
MNKRIIIGLVLLMGISLLGIVAVQLYWFNNSVTVRNELFDRSVNEAMNKAVRRLETGHDLKVIRRMGATDSIVWDQNFPAPPPPPPPPPGYENMDIVVRRDTVTRTISFSTSNSSHAKKKNIVVMSTSKPGKKDNSVQVLTEDHFGNLNDTNIHIELPVTDTIVGRKIKQLRNLSNQIRIEYKGWETGRHIDEVQLRKLLKEELLDRAIPIGFNISIVGGDSIPAVDSKAHASQRWYKVNLFPDDIFRKKLELAVNFPERDQFIGRKTTMLLGLSVVFTLIIFLTFILSIYQIIRQKKISEMKSDFINNMTHEFKTPIATISIAADSIANDKVIHEEERVRFFAGMIKKENIRMNEQVERILQIARLDRKEFEFSFQAVDVHPLIEAAVNGIVLQVEKRGGSIETRLEAFNPVVTTDPIHFTNLVFNLLDNANKYSPDAPVIKVSTTNAPDGILLSVEDSGMGMTKAVQSRIFDKFYRLPSGNIHTIKGFGLGLSYIKAILEANNGTIKVHSEPGKGSRFVVFIPFLNTRK